MFYAQSGGILSRDSEFLAEWTLFWKGFRAACVHHFGKASMGEQATPLTPTEARVVRLLTLGCSVRQVAMILDRSPSTVDNHKTKAMKKLGVHHIAMLTRRALAIGITELADELSQTERQLITQSQIEVP